MTVCGAILSMLLGPGHDYHQMITTQSLALCSGSCNRGETWSAAFDVFHFSSMQRQAMLPKLICSLLLLLLCSQHVLRDALEDSNF